MVVGLLAVLGFKVAQGSGYKFVQARALPELRGLDGGSERVYLSAHHHTESVYSISDTGQRLGSSSEKKIILHIRNTLLVSGMTGIMAVLLSATAGYAFARMKFEGRYNTLLSFLFVQMFQVLWRW